MPDSDPSASVKPPQPETSETGHSAPFRFSIQFWGVRGDIPTPGSDTVRYGGNTSCIEMRVGNQLLIFDAGTGLRVLGKNLLRQLPIEAHLFFTHCHWDRIQGFPFFVPGFIPGNRFHIYGASASNGASLKQRLNEQMLPPNFPVPIQIMGSDLKFYHLEPGDTVALDEISIETGCLNRENHTTGYRVSSHGYTAVYATDALSDLDYLNPSLLHLARNADLLIYDISYKPYSLSKSNFAAAKPTETDWKDLLWKTGIAIAKAAGVKRLVMCHHDPTYTDDLLDSIELQLQSVFPQGWLAKEGMMIELTN